MQDDTEKKKYLREVLPRKSCHKYSNKIGAIIFPATLTFFGLKMFGALNGSHISVTALTARKQDFSNRKGWDSIILQAIVDDKLQYVIFVSRSFIPQFMSLFLT